MRRFLVYALCATSLVIGSLNLGGCAMQNPDAPPPGAPVGSPTLGELTTAEGADAIAGNEHKIASIRINAQMEGRPLTTQEEMYIALLVSDNRDIQRAIDDFHAEPPPPEPNEASGDPVAVAIMTLGGLLPAPFGPFVLGFVPPAWVALRHLKRSGALTAVVNAIKKTRERDPVFAEALSRNAPLFNQVVGPSKDTIDGVRRKLGDDPNHPPGAVPAPGFFTTAVTS